MPVLEVPRLRIKHLTYNRAAYWAFTNGSYDFDQALAAGKAATAQVRNNRHRRERSMASSECVDGGV